MNSTIPLATLNKLKAHAPKLTIHHPPHHGFQQLQAFRAQRFWPFQHHPIPGECWAVHRRIFKGSEWDPPIRSTPSETVTPSPFAFSTQKNPRQAMINKELFLWARVSNRAYTTFNIFGFANGSLWYLQAMVNVKPSHRKCPWLKEGSWAAFVSLGDRMFTLWSK